MALAPLYGSLIPTQSQQVTSDSYLSFTDGTGKNFAQQYLPEIYEAEVERYGNRTLGGFLRMVGAEMPMTSDQVIWSEQNRLHVSYSSATTTVSAAGIITLGTAAGSPNTVENVIKPNMTVVVMTPGAAATAVKCIVGDSGNVSGSALAAMEIQVFPYAGALPAVGVQVKVFVYGSEFPKGSSGVQENITPSFTQFNNKPVIIRDRYVVSGSDTAQIGWVEVAAEDGTSGYLWYLKAEGETRLRFEDYLEMTLVEGEKAAAAAAGNFANAAATSAAFQASTGFNTVNDANLGTEGLFAAISARGNVFTAFGGALVDFDAILGNLDSQGAIEENMLFLDRSTELDIDNMLASQNSYGIGGTSYGVFENSEEMALNLQFSGFRRGSYDFYKTSWKYLNDASTRGNDSAFTTGDNIDGVLIPAGTSTVYDQILGTNIRRPFLHVRYRASQTDDRRMKSWITGSVGGAVTSDLDAMEVHFLSERCLCVQAANNFVLLKK